MSVTAMPKEPFARVADPYVTSSERTYATAGHLSILLVHVLIPVVPALAIWLIRRGESPFLDDHGRESVNFQISLVLYFLLAMALTPVCGIGVLMIPGIYILGIVGMVMGAIAAQRGEFFRYPACVRVLSRG